MDFSETIVVYDLKLATDAGSDKKFLLTSKLCPLGAVCPQPRGYIHVLNHEKNALVDNQISSPRGCQPLPWGYIHVENHEEKKKCIKSDFKENFLNL